MLETEDVVAAAGPLEGIRFEVIGPVELKGLTESVPLQAARKDVSPGARARWSQVPTSR
ncbi:MAG TPA: hypothetical protein VM451_05475 [Candidatus Limnocylindria bacterium]|nr:hypothetical protein [Candidatus Limnocylindria bacterium]